MGTNYYWTPNLAPAACESCGRPCETCENGVHIGKSSMGWVFALHIHPALGIRTLDDWKHRWKSGTISDEYGEPLDVVDMLARILDRCPREPADEAFHRVNHSAPGPRGLAKAKPGTEYGRTILDPPGDETYQLHDYEFS